MANRGANSSGPDMMDPPVSGNNALPRALVAAPGTAPAPYGGGSGAHGPEIVHGGFNQTWLAHCLRRRWLMVILMGLLVGALTAGALLWAFPPTSQVTAYLKVKSGSGDSLFPDARERITYQEMEKQAMNHLALLRAPMVLELALQNQDVAQLDAVRANKGQELLWLMSELRVSFPGNGEILEVRYEGDADPDQMVKVIDEVVKAYQEKVLISDRIAAEATQIDLATVLGTIKTRLSSLLKEYETKAKDKGLFTEDIEIPIIRNELAMWQKRLLDAQQMKTELSVFRAASLQAARDTTAIELMVQQEAEQDPMVNSIKQQIFGVQQSIQQKLASSKNQNSPQIKLLESQIQQLNAQEQQYRRNAERAARDKYKLLPNEQLKKDIQEFNIRWETAEQNEQEAMAKIEELNSKLMTMGVKDPEIEMLMREIENEQLVANQLEQKVREAKVRQDAGNLKRGDDQTSDLEKVSVMQWAKPVRDINRMERWSIAGIGGLAAMALTGYAIALLEFRHRRLNGPTDVDEGLGVRVLGVLPSTSLKSLGGNSLVATQVAEAIDNVRATLMHDSTSRSSQVVMITSAGSQEGSSVVASSLALSLSRAGRRTLLVDGDLRSADLHKLFGMPLEGGLSEVLRSEIELDDAVRPTNNDKLYLLSAGVCDADAIHALATHQPQVIFEKLRQQFDFVVIDAPPVLGISDSLSLGQYIDGVILTVLRDQSEIRQVYQAVELLKRMGIRLIGSVVNGVPVKVDRRVVRLHQATAKRQLQLPPAKVEATVEADSSAEG
jgi:capsular exopolysaccharide synthesis family protein